MTFGIRGNTDKVDLPSTVAKAVSELEKHKISYLVETGLAMAIKKDTGRAISKNRIATPAEIVRKSDFIVSVGGDGTFLATAKLVNSREIPIIGVNMGKLGYLAEIPVNKMVSFIGDVINQHYKIEERSVLAAHSSTNGKTLHGMNEIVISQSGIVRTVFLEVFYDDSLVISYHADGLIVSTPIGSTGYSLSAGGPIAMPDTDVLIVCPICPHTFTARPIILPDTGVIKVKIQFRQPVNVTADGNDSYSIRKDCLVVIVKASYKVKVVKSLDHNYFEVLNKKLLWGEDKRNSKT